MNQYSITIMITDADHVATKTYSRGKDLVITEVPYNAGRHFRPLAYETNSIHDLFRLLTEIQDDSHFLLIQGEVLPAFRHRSEITRTLLDIPEEHQIAMLGPKPDGSLWMMGDFDKIDLPTGMSVEAGVEMLVQTLPTEFHDVSYAYELSSSAGISGPGRSTTTERDPSTSNYYQVVEHYEYLGWTKLSAHVFFWFSTPQHNLAQWATNLNAVRNKRIIDPAPLRPIQPNYTARPLFSGMDDPVGDRRIGFVQKAKDTVDLVWIDRPTVYVAVEGQRYAAGTRVGDAVATPSVMDRIADIGGHGGYREPMKAAIGYYYWLKGNTGNAAAIKDLILSNSPTASARPGYKGRHLDNLIDWYARRATHDPLRSSRDDDAALTARMIELRANTPLFATDRQPEEDEHDDWGFDREELGLSFWFIAGECGLGKTQWLLDRVANEPDRYVICLPRIEHIREVVKRLRANHGDLVTALGYQIETIYRGKANELIVDADDADDEPASKNRTVAQQADEFLKNSAGRPRVVLFITHAALQLNDWSRWSKFHLMIDEIFDPYHIYSQDFRRTGDYVRAHVQPDTDISETNFHHLTLTEDGWARFRSGAGFDDNEPALENLMRAIARRNPHVYAHKGCWDKMSTQRTELMSLLHPGFLRFFRTVTVMGDEFDHSTLALAFERKFSVNWQPHPNWRPTRNRGDNLLASRVRLFYFLGEDDRRGSLTFLRSTRAIPKLVEWFGQDANNPGQVLITTNREFRHNFAPTKTGTFDVAAEDGVYRTATTIREPLLWVPPKQAGTDEYKTMRNVAFFAAMRPSADERAFVAKSLDISEDDIIRWREYNTLFQFIMRINLRIFDSAKICNVYCLDFHQAAYLRERFGGCLEFNHITGVLGGQSNLGGRPKIPEGAMSAGDRKRRQRERDKILCQGTA